MEKIPPKDTYNIDNNFSDEIAFDPYCNQSVYHSQSHIYRRMNTTTSKKENFEGIGRY